MMKSLAGMPPKDKKKNHNRGIRIVTAQEYEGLEVNGKIELIKALIPLGLMHAAEELQKEVTRLAGEWYEHEKGGKLCVRYGSNRSSIRIGGQKVPLVVPRVRNLRRDQEVPLQTLRQLREGGDLDELLLRRVLWGISCRNYEAAAGTLPEALGLSSSTVSRKFIEATAAALQEFQERDLSALDIIALVVDGKSFAEDTMVIAIGVTIAGDKVALGFVQAGTENAEIIGAFLRKLVERGLCIEEGLLVCIDGGKGLRAAVEQVFAKQALVQRCQWHKRENVVKYLPKGEQAAMRKKLQQAYEKPTYEEAKAALMKIHAELEQRNLSAVASLAEGLEETLTLHRLGLFPVLGVSLKTTNIIESILSQVEKRCGKVSCWKNSSQKQRWLATALLDIEPRLHRIKGHMHLPLLRQALQEQLHIKHKIQAA
jgi:putative transposase